MTVQISVEEARKTIRKNNRDYRRRLTITSAFLFAVGILSGFIAILLIASSTLTPLILIPAGIAIFEGIRRLVQARHVHI
ncbi:MAG: hypothetical protein Q4D85_06245 [Corynebacterium sp.]|uniref:hypothetical protein n=1 Tax=Corynebacterium sp. TaxID=1720 RepID=UPI0026DBDD1F|nr:hypothetical protein [Corynebacterium sp.]MDO5098344.1 hypothetical protein [Corynebacterium sp.]